MSSPPDRTFNLVEIIFSLVLITAVMLPIYASFPLAIEEVRIGKRQLSASHALREKLEQVLLDFRARGFEYPPTVDYSDSLTDVGNFTRAVTLTASGSDEIRVEVTLEDTDRLIPSRNLIYFAFRDTPPPPAASGHSLAGGEYFNAGGQTWILLDPSTGLSISRGKVANLRFDDNKQVWETTGAGNIAELNPWLNQNFYATLTHPEQFIKPDGIWQIPPGQGQRPYVWTGKMAPLLKYDFNRLRTDGSLLKGTAFKAVDHWGIDPNMNESWWLLDPDESSPLSTWRVGENPGELSTLAVSNALAIRPTFFLKTGYTRISGDGTAAFPYEIAY